MINKMKFIFLSLIVTIAFGINFHALFERGDKLMITATILHRKELYLFARCNQYLYKKITKNINKCVNDDLKFFEDSCENDLKGYAKLEIRLNWIESSFKIDKMPNGNFQITPMNHFLPQEMMVSYVSGDYENKFAHVSSYPEENGTKFSYSSGRDLPLVLAIRNKTEAECHSLGEKQISITPQNIGRFFQICANQSPVIRKSFLFYERRANEWFGNILVFSPVILFT